MATKAGSAYIEVRADNAHLQGDLNKSHSRIEAAAMKMEQSITRILKIGMAAGVAAVGTAAVISVKQFADFEVALNRLGNVSDRSLGSMRKEILGMSSELGSVTELTKGYYQVLSAGITDANKSMQMLTVSAKMSKEAAIAQGDAVRGLVAVMGAYSDELKTASDAADLLYSIEKSGITSVGELIPLIGNLANLSTAVGLSANEMAAALAQITTTGAGTGIAVTQLQSLLVALNQNFTKLPPIIQEYGSAIAAVKAMGFQNVLKEIIRYTDGNATALTKMLGRQEGYLGLLQLSKNEFGDYAERLQNMTDKIGSFDDAWQRYSKTLTAVWDTFKNTVGRQAVLLGEKLVPKLKEVTERMSAWVEQNDKLIEQKTFEAIDKITTSIKGIVSVYNALPDGVIGAAGTGIITRILTGSTPIGEAVAALYLINVQLEKIGMNIGSIIGKARGLEENLANIWGVVTGELDPNTGLPKGMFGGGGPGGISGAGRGFGTPTSPPTLPSPPSPPTSPPPALYKGFTPFLPLPELWEPEPFAMDESLTAEFERIEQERLRIVADFNSQYADLGKSQVELERERIMEQAKIWEMAGADKVQVAEWTAEKLKEISGNEFSAITEFGVQAAHNIQDAFSDFFYDAFTGELDTARDYFRAFTETMTRAWSNMLSQMLMESMQMRALMSGIKGIGGFLSGLFGGGVSGPIHVGIGGTTAFGMHGGGIVGENTSFTRTVPSFYFNNAPRFHDGLSADEFPAILQRGETVIPKGKQETRQKETVNYNIVIQAVDAKSFSDLTKRNPQAIIGPIVSAINDNNSSMRTSIRTAMGK